MVGLIELERLKYKTEGVNTERWEDDGGRIIEMFHLPRNRKRRNPMEKRVGLWIDRKKAVIVSIANNVEARRIITADMANYVKYSIIGPRDGSPEYVRDGRFWNHVGEYYAKIIEHIRDAAEIQIFGPEGAKYELQKRLESQGLAGHIVSVEDTKKLTDIQISTKVLQRFPLLSRFDFS